MADQAQPMTIDQIQSALAKNSQNLSNMYASLPQTQANLRTMLFGNDQTLNSLQDNQASKIKELFNHDQMLASNYQPQTPGFIEDPGAKAAYSSRITANQAGELADIQKAIANRKNTLGDALDRGMQMALYGLEALKQEQSGLQSDRDFAEKQKEHKDELSLQYAQLNGGQTSTERDANRARKSLQNDVQSGVPFYELYSRYSDVLPEFEIRQTYNQGPVAKKYGAAKETSNQLIQSKALAQKPLVLSADQKKQAGYADSTLRLLSNLESTADNFNGTGPIYGAATRTFQNISPQLADQNLMKMDSQIGPIRDQILNLISGANVSAKEADRVQSWIPSITNSPEKNRANLASLKTWLQEKYRSATNTDWKPPASNGKASTNTKVNNKVNPNDPLGLGI